MSDHVTALIRTWVPILVGWAAVQLARLGIEIDSATLAATLTAVISGLWYWLVRLLERRWPGIGWLLGKPSQPTYTRPSD